MSVRSTPMGAIARYMVVLSLTECGASDWPEIRTARKGRVRQVVPAVPDFGAGDAAEDSAESLPVMGVAVMGMVVQAAALIQKSNSAICLGMVVRAAPRSLTQPHAAPTPLLLCHTACA